jgi:hypothetical protein
MGNFTTVWANTLIDCAEGLDIINDSDARAVFRINVLRATENLMCAGIRELAAYYGASDIPTSRDDAAHVLADAFIATAAPAPTEEMLRQLTHDRILPSRGYSSMHPSLPDDETLRKLAQRVREPHVLDRTDRETVAQCLSALISLRATTRKENTDV